MHLHNAGLTSRLTEFKLGGVWGAGRFTRFRLEFFTNAAEHDGVTKKFTNRLPGNRSLGTRLRASTALVIDKDSRLSTQ